ncbi:MAG: bifunctional aspartate kinase/homoserine dehydrogenase I [Spirosomataceae bacterium]
MKVLKFGGTSVGTLESIDQVVSIIQHNVSSGQKIAVVYSAMGGVTNRLIEVGKQASEGQTTYLEVLRQVEERHFHIIRQRIDIKHQSAVMAQTRGLFNELEDILKGVSLLRELSLRTQDFILSFGERLSTYLMTEVLRSCDIPAHFVDARNIIKTDAHFSMAEVIPDLTQDLIQRHFAEHSDSLACITGFIASTQDRVTTTLGRGGSDYTASIVGAALDAEVIEIWTDVNGMMTADPRKVKNAFTIPQISYAEAMELSHFGAKVIYPPSLIPAFKKNIPIQILNTFEKEHPGTTVARDVPKQPYPITGISSIDDIALVNLQGNGMIGVAGVSAKVFSLLAKHRISVILISQASSEHSICFAVDPKSAAGVKEILTEGFEAEIAQGWIDQIVVEHQLSVIAIVGEGMKATSGTSGKLFTVLGKNGINVIATAQGSSELNISVVIQKKDISKALNAIHEAFFAVDGMTLHLFLAGGTGLIGKTLLRQLQAQKAFLKSQKNINIRVVGMINSRKMWMNTEGIDLDSWEQDWPEKSETAQLSTFMEDMVYLNLPNSIFVDSTANKDIIQYYEGLLKQSISIVTPNKVANSGPYSQYVALQKAARQGNARFLYETNVGAGLPIINTLQGLITSGDKIHKIEAVLSGTLSFIFNTFQPGLSFAEVVRQAQAEGYTEPDPREDLSGMDVARKILILARETGIALEPADVVISPLMSETMQSAPSVEAFYEALVQERALFDAQIEEAQKSGKVLRFIASLENGKAHVGLQMVGPEHPFFNLAGSENIISFTTDRYRYNPLVVKGPGAGAEVTAMGVFADIMSIHHFLN